MDDPRQSQKVWEADLGEPGRKLTALEVAALEAMHQCRLLTELLDEIRAVRAYLASLEGRLDRVEVYLARLDPQRYPSQPGVYVAPALPPRDGR